MQTYWRHLSPGYIGVHEKELTLNAQYYSIVFADIPTYLGHSLLLPQRIPKTGFFDEIFDFEDNDFKNAFENQVNSLIRLSKKTPKEDADNFIISNALKILVRLGQSSYDENFHLNSGLSVIT